MNDNKEKIYINKIIEEYNVLLKPWGPSESWNLNQFRTLQKMIFETTKVDINANTLKRIFQQKTSNPQLATKDALCIFLGYSGYTDFIIKKTREEDAATGVNSPIEDNLSTRSAETNTGYLSKTPEYPNRKNQKYKYLIFLMLLTIAGYCLYAYKLKDMYKEYLISKIQFSTSQIKGICPLTVTFSYDIPSALFDDITLVQKEANGDMSEKRLNRDKNKVNATYIYEGEGFGYLRYKGKIIRSLKIQSRKAGWSVFIREERKNIFKALPINQAFNDSGYISLPFDNIPQDARTNHLFVSYLFYKDKLVDGDNFIYEARVRNSEKEYAIPCADIMMYIHSDSATHGFAMNENGYAYIKFISGENTIKGDEYNLSRFNFNSSEWHIMSIRVENKKTTFSVDGEEVLNMEYNTPSGYANELVLRFKGCGAVDYVKVYTPDSTLIYEENFEQPFQ